VPRFPQHVVFVTVASVIFIVVVALLASFDVVVGPRLASQQQPLYIAVSIRLRNAE
jgi:hypothetical protein